MERERWLQVYRMLLELDHDAFRGVFTAATILAVYFWAVLHDRPVVWACRRENWPAGLWVGPLPTQATMSRRLRDPRVDKLFNVLERHVRALDAATIRDEVLAIDGKPLPVGGHSKDPDAGWGRGVRTWAKGFKFYAVWGEHASLPTAWRVASMHTSEQAAAERMIPQLSSRGHLLGDKLYDINKLYAAADAVGLQLVAERKRPHCGLGHRPHHPARLRALALLQTAEGRRLYERRDAVERHFGGLTGFGGGLSPLPGWVRRLPRVRLWVQAKLVINALRLQKLHVPNMHAIA
jgi:hypothetical protein